MKTIRTQRYKKDVKFTNILTRYINACKILFILPTHQSSNPAPILEYNTTYHLDFPSDMNKEDISPGISNNSVKGIRSTDIDINTKDIRSKNINRWRLATLNWTP